jgi:hypothetical protein
VQADLEDVVGVVHGCFAAVQTGERGVPFEALAGVHHAVPIARADVDHRGRTQPGSIMVDAHQR